MIQYLIFVFFCFYTITGFKKAFRLGIQNAGFTNNMLTVLSSMMCDGTIHKRHQEMKKKICLIQFLFEFLNVYLYYVCILCLVKGVF